MHNNRLIIQVLFITCLFTPLSSLALNNKDSISSDTARLYEKALVEFNEGEVDTAVIYLKNLLLEEPSYLSAHILLGKGYLAQGQGTLAEKELKRAEELGADKSSIHGQLAQALMLQVKYRDVLDQIFPLGVSKEDDSAMIVYRGQSYFQLGNIDKATREFNDALEMNPASIDALLGLATIELSVQDYKKTDQYIRQAIDIDHQNASVWFVKGAWHHAQSQTEEATIAYETALDIDPEHFNAKLSIAGLFMDKMDYKAAEEAFLSLYKDAPENPQIAYFLSVAALKLNDKEKAKKLMRDAKTHIDRLPIEVINDHGPTLMLAGLIYYDLGEYQLAKNFLGGFVNKFPADTRARLMLGRIYLLEGALSKTIEALEPSLKFNPSNYQVLLLLGDAYMKKKDYFKASQVFSQASQYYPDDVAVKTKAGLNDLLRGQSEEGLEALSDAVELSTEASSAGFILVTNLLKKGRVQDALNAAKRLSEKSPDNLLVQNLLATTQLSAGLRSNARDTWTSMLDKNPEFNIAKINLIKLDINEGKLDTAEAGLVALQKTDPDNSTYLYDLADIQLRKQDRDTAIKTLTQAISVDPKNFKIAGKLVDLYIDNGEPGKAFKISSKIAGEHFEHAGSYYLLGKSHIALGEAYKALPALKKASQLAAYDSPFLKQVSQLQLNINDLNGSVHSINKYISSFNDDAEAWYTLALAQMRLERSANIDQAIEELRRLGYEALANKLLGDLAYQQPDYISALKFYRLSLEQKPIAETAQQIFTALSAKDGMSVGASFLAEWLKSYPKEHYTREMLAQAYVTTEQFDKAELELEKLHSAGWKSPVTIVNLAYVYQIKTDKRAEKYAREAVALMPENPFALDILGWQLVLQSKLDEGLKYLREAYARDSRSPTVRFHIASVLSQLGRVNEAKGHLSEILITDIPFREQEQAKELSLKLDM